MMSLAKRVKSVIQQLGRAWSWLAFRFGDDRRRIGRMAEIDAATAGELQKIVAAEGLSAVGGQALVQTVVRLYSGYKRAHEKARMEADERLERIVLLSHAILRLRQTQTSPSGVSNARAKEKLHRGMRGKLIFKKLSGQAEQIWNKVIAVFEDEKLSNLSKLAEAEGLPPDTDSRQRVRAVMRLYSGYKKSYENSALQNSERLERIQLLSAAYENLCRGGTRPFLIPNRKLAVLHVPKTGGTSLHQELKTCFPNATFLDAGHGPLERAETGELDAFDIIFGHMYLHNLVKHSTGRYKALFLRDPITQAVSIWGFMRSFANDPALCRRPDIVAALRYDFDTYIKTDDPHAYNTKRNRYGRTLLGEQFKDCDLDEKTAQRLQQRLEEIDFVGLFEHYDEDSQTLLRILGAEHTAGPVWLNRTPERIPKEKISEETRDAILRKSSLDAELYRLALLRRQERLSRDSLTSCPVSQRG